MLEVFASVGWTSSGLALLVIGGPLLVVGLPLGWVVRDALGARRDARRVPVGAEQEQTSAPRREGPHLGLAPLSSLRYLPVAESERHAGRAEMTGVRFDVARSLPAGVTVEQVYVKLAMEWREFIGETIPIGAWDNWTQLMLTATRQNRTALQGALSRRMDLHYGEGCVVVAAQARSVRSHETVEQAAATLYPVASESSAGEPFDLHTVPTTIGRQR